MVSLQHHDKTWTFKTFFLVLVVVKVLMFHFYDLKKVKERKKDGYIIMYG